MKRPKKQRAFIRSAKQVENLIRKKVAEIEAVALSNQQELFPQNTTLPHLVEELEWLKQELAYKRVARKPRKVL